MRRARFLSSAAKAGATPGEVAELLGVALLMDGGTASVYSLFKPGAKPLDVIYPEVNRYLSQQQGLIDAIPQAADFLLKEENVTTAVVLSKADIISVRDLPEALRRENGHARSLSGQRASPSAGPRGPVVGRTQRVG